MLHTKDAHKHKVFVQSKKGKVKRYGRVRNVVFHPSKPVAVGLMVKRPDLALMVKRKDAFIALDKISLTEDGDILVCADDGDAWDARACKRMGIEYDSCIIWDGMPVRNLENVELGCISNIAIDEKTLRIAAIDISTGDINRVILGSSDIVAEKLRGYDHKLGAIVADIQPEEVEINGGVAAKAGEAWAVGKHKVGKTQQAVSERAAENIEETAYAAGEAIGSIRDKVKDSEASKKASELGAKAGEAINDGAYKLGCAIGSMKESRAESKKEPDDTEEASAKKEASDEDDGIDAAAQAVGEHLKKTKGMFRAFKEEFDKASK